MGNAISACVQVVEGIKDKLSGLKQDNSISTQDSEGKTLTVFEVTLTK